MKKLIYTLVISTNFANADVYKCEEPDGRIVYQDKPCNGITLDKKEQKKNNSEKKWNIMGAEIKDSEIYNERYLYNKIEKSKRDLIDVISYSFKIGEAIEYDVSPVDFSGIKISEKRFFSMPIICGKYTSARNSSPMRYVYGLMGGIIVETPGKEYPKLIDDYCVWP